MSNNTSLEALKAHLFEAIEGVKNLSDSQASDCEKTSIEQAKAIVAAADSIIDIYKVQLEGVQLANKMDNAMTARAIVTELGIIEDDAVKKIGF
jgi:hypothetical protein